MLLAQCLTNTCSTLATCHSRTLFCAFAPGHNHIHFLTSCVLISERSPLATLMSALASDMGDHCMLTSFERHSKISSSCEHSSETGVVTHFPQMSRTYNPGRHHPIISWQQNVSSMQQSWSAICWIYSSDFVESSRLSWAAAASRIHQCTEFKGISRPNNV